MRSQPVQYLDQSAAAGTQLWAVALEYQLGNGEGGAYLINLSFFMNTSSNQTVESRLAES